MISLLVAYSKTNRVIGAQGKIPWNLHSERRRFKQICNGKKVYMGRKTFEEIGHALPYCTIVIISKSMEKAPDGCELIKSINEIFDDGEVLIAGGGEIFQQIMPSASKIYATEILADFDGDVTFPELDDSWIETKRVHLLDDALPYDYVTFEKNK